MECCSGCGAALDAGVRFCSRCGRKVQDECSQCGASVRGRFCSQCGAQASPLPQGRSFRFLTIAVCAILFVLLAAVGGYAAFRPRGETPKTYPELMNSGNRHMDAGMRLADQNDRSGALREWRVAIRDFEAAITLKPADLHARSDLGLVYVYSGQFEQAEETLQAVLQDDPSYLWALFNLAWIYRTGGEDLRALELYQRYLDAVETEGQLRDKYADHYELISLQTERARAEVATLNGADGAAAIGGGTE